MNDQPMATLGALLTRAWAFYRANARLVLLVTLPVVAFVDLVIGAGLGELTASVHKKLPSSDIYIELAATEFVTVPLVARSSLPCAATLRCASVAWSRRDSTCSCRRSSPCSCSSAVSWSARS
jgi:hypothetical protein